MFIELPFLTILRTYFCPKFLFKKLYIIIVNFNKKGDLFWRFTLLYLQLNEISNLLQLFPSKTKRKNSIMKNIALRTLAIVLFISTSLASCSSDDGGETVIVLTSYITDVTGPETGVVNQDITFNVKYFAENGCGSFDQFIQTQSGNTKTILAQVKYIGDNCGNTQTEITTPYTFNVNVPGTYTFKFRKNASQFITREVIVE